MPSSTHEGRTGPYPQGRGLHHRLHGGQGRAASTSWSLELKYTEDRRRVISQVKRISKPGRRIYAKKDNLPKVLGGLGVAVISTSRGMMTAREAQAAGCRRRSRLLRLVDAMSRIGRAPIPSPAGVDVTIDGSSCDGQRAQGRAGARRSAPTWASPSRTASSRSRGPAIRVRTARCTGSRRTLLSNMVTGVTAGFEKRLEIEGVGYRAALKGTDLEIQVGYSPPGGGRRPREHRVRGAGAHADRGEGHRQATGRPGRRRHPLHPASPSRTRARASGTQGEVVRRKVGKRA